MLVSRIDEFNYDAARKDYVLTHERYWAINENVRENELVAQIRRWTPDNGQKPVVVRNSTSQPLGVPVAAAKLDAKDALSLAATAQSAGLELRANKKFATIQLYKTAEKDVLCVWDGGHYSAISFIENSSVKGPGSLKPSSDDLACSNLAATDKAENVHGVRYAIQLRSVEGIFYYLGSLLKSDHPPLQFYFRRRSDQNTRFSVEYNGSSYFIDNFGDTDDTAVILAILSDLLNLQRQADETPTTKAVQAVP